MLGTNTLPTEPYLQLWVSSSNSLFSPSSTSVPSRVPAPPPAASPQIGLSKPVAKWQSQTLREHFLARDLTAKKDSKRAGCSP